MASKTCPRCGGSGYWGQSGVIPGSGKGSPCPQCNGSGWVYTEEPKRGNEGCFITTATLSTLGKPDDCYELTTFRSFRDNWLAKQVGGKQLILEYYNIAPKIVSEINSLSHDHKKTVYKNLWEQQLKPCLKLIEEKEFSVVKKEYETIILRLRKDYLNEV